MVVPDPTDDPKPGQASRFVVALADHPLLVVVATFVVGAAATAILALCVHGLDAVGVVTTVASLWALDLALVIYLLTARDTDKLLARIDAAQDQLAAVLAAPGSDAEVVEAATGATPAEPVDNVDSAGATVASAPVRPGPPTVAGRLPADYLTAYTRHTGVAADDIRLAWTPQAKANGPWVLEDNRGDRWSVFQGAGARPTVIALGNADRLRQRRQDARQRLRQRVDTRSGRDRPTPPEIEEQP